MPVYGITDHQGAVWAFNPDVIYAIVRGAARASIIRRRSRVVEHDPGWGLPTTYNVEINWSGYRTELEEESAHLWAQTELALCHDPETTFENLLGLLTQMENDQDWHRRQTRASLDRSHASISRYVQDWNTGYQGLRLVRDLSATVLVVVPGIVAAPGGAALAAGAGITGVTAGSTGAPLAMLAVGSSLRGFFTYQDTGSVGSAALGAGGTFVTGAIGLGAAGAMISTAETGVILAINTAASGLVGTGQALFEGKELEQVAVAALGSMGSSIAGAALGPIIRDFGFLMQVTALSGADVAVARATEAAIDNFGSQNSRMPRPQVEGSVDFYGCQIGESREFLRNCALRKL